MTLLGRLLGRIAQGVGRPIPLRLAFWGGESFEFASATAVSVVLTTSRMARLMIGGDLYKLCDAYLSGEILVEDVVPDIVECGFGLVEMISRVPLCIQSQVLLRLPAG